MFARLKGGIVTESTRTIAAPGSSVKRWECNCQTPPVLLGTYDRSGTVHIKVRDRYWHVTGGTVRTTCPRCGGEHSLPAAVSPAAAPAENGSG
jgi:hypothetical protein